MNEAKKREMVLEFRIFQENGNWTSTHSAKKILSESGEFSQLSPEA
jgi:hypothetical protein